ncbi:MAG: hypothetical protein M1834_007917 [Cirrosporium novae-zelandiae]|nr:MAG: hypothetical protein M1834_007917 [Cirrosporium novae-zelandiae]
MAPLLPFRDINVHASTTHYAFTSPSSPQFPTLVVERPSGDIRLNDGILLGGKRVSSIAGILGIIKLKLDKYIIVITKAQPMGRLKGHMVYKVIATEFLPLRERSLHDPDEDAYLGLLKNLIKNGPLYFSYSFDVTNSFQRQAHADLTAPLWKRADDRFFWNRFIQTDLIDFRTGGSRNGGSQQPGADPYILPIMYGMFEIKKTKIKQTPFLFALITRRSRHRGGTRYFSRGIDENGNVSNYNETEQLVILNDNGAGLGGFGAMPNGRTASREGQEVQVLSYVQTRGSVPVFFAEINDLNYRPRLEVRGVDTAANAARKHFEEQISLYGENYLVNLVNQKGREERVKNAYEQMVRLLMTSPQESTEADSMSREKLHVVQPGGNPQKPLDHLHYVYFDFHNETKGLKWHRTDLLLDQLMSGLNKGGYFRAVDMPGDTQGQMDVKKVQTCVVRTNCMDCLDRTNVVQSMLARWALNRQLLDLGILQPGESATDDVTFDFTYRNIWADNADVVAKSYTGTGALKTDFTRTGKRTRAGMLQDLNNSITRYLMNNFSDGPRQDAFDLLLGTYLPSSSPFPNVPLFADRRPTMVQAIPYIFFASIFMILVATFTRRLPDATVWPLRLFVIFWFVVGGWCTQFMLSNGMLYVNWPKLNTPPWASEGFHEALSNVRRDKVLGPLINGHERGVSTSKLSHLEEGKKRIE